MKKRRVPTTSDGGGGWGCFGGWAKTIKRMAIMCLLSMYADTRFDIYKDLRISARVLFSVKIDSIYYNRYIMRGLCSKCLRTIQYFIPDLGVISNPQNFQNPKTISNFDF